MKVKQNIGILNALIRITCGLTMLAWGTAKLSKKPWRQSYLFIAFLGAMRVGEGILQYCPLTDLWENGSFMNQQNNQNRQNQQNQQKQQNQADRKEDIDIPYNPS
ncbi:YgaP family membrane protein [Bacillus smithii]|uniref:Inner membrane protein YgaP-like transmembrane domain-containing protein n=1 Tax=Bacillus smithii 7_3_47FAA TaxID=665952 RepID=G9QL58_9BACI|nr:DUF2892 domain-containing protein [Bacillus smithii]EHL78123.1 hypothetical protein HMPREF1015_02468 [Bacillus smithii 7_3_47FAA]